MAQGACTDSNYAHQFGLPGLFAPIADFRLLETAVEVARRMGVEPPVGNLLSSDVFYDKSGRTMEWGPWGSWRWRWRPPPSTATPLRPASGR